MSAGPIFDRVPILSRILLKDPHKLQTQSQRENLDSMFIAMAKTKAHQSTIFQQISSLHAQCREVDAQRHHLRRNPSLYSRIKSGSETESAQRHYCTATVALKHTTQSDKIHTSGWRTLEEDRLAYHTRQLAREGNSCQILEELQ